MPIYTTDEMTVEEFADMVTGEAKPSPHSRRCWDDQRWIESHIAEVVKKHSGQWVIVYDGQVIGASPDLGIARREAAGRVADREVSIFFAADDRHVFKVRLAVSHLPARDDPSATVTRFGFSGLLDRAKVYFDVEAGEAWLEI